MTAPELSPDQLRARLGRDDLFLLDVREPAEVDDWAFPGAVNIPLGDLGGRMGELPETGDIVVICHSGRRSAAAANALSEAGWPAYNLAGGVVAWVASSPDE